MSNPSIKRFIPVLTIADGKLVKTKQFSSPKYLGDPINAIKIFNAKEVDELVILDINASLNNSTPNLQLIEEMASEAFMPVAYGGGIKNVSIAKEIMKCGVEKMVFNTALFEKPTLIKELANIYGNQCIVACLDYKKNFLGKHFAYYKSGNIKVKKDIEELVAYWEEMGIGELYIHDIDAEGTFKGYSFQILEKLLNKIEVPIILLGGANSIENMHSAIKNHGAHAAAASSIFVFKNNDRNSILINYGK